MHHRPGRLGSDHACSLRSLALTGARHRYPRASSISLAAARPIGGIQCEYRSRVSFMLLWPSSCWTYVGCVPRASKIVAHEWRRSWNLISGNPPCSRAAPTYTQSAPN
jgi:hypothetical protein